MGNIIKKCDILSVRPIDKLRFKRKTYQQSTIGGIISLISIIILLYAGISKFMIIYKHE